MKLKCRIPLKVYDCMIEFLVTPEIVKDHKRICKKVSEDPGNDDTLEGMFIYGNQSKVYYLLINTDNLTHNCIAHEVYHAATQICDHRNIEEEETRAWLSGFITGEIYKFLDKKQQTVKHE